MRESNPGKRTAPQYISYTVGGDEYALQISHIKEINKVALITRIPQSPDFVAGVVDLRGSIIPIIDMRMKLGYPEASTTKSDRIIVCSIRGQAVGLLVDAVYHVLSIPEENLMPPPEMFNSIDVRFIDAMARIGERLILFLNLDKLIDPIEVVGISESDEQAVTSREV